MHRPSVIKRINVRRPNRGGGFSLIELIAVMVVVAILAASAVPAWISMTERRSAVAARLLQRDLEFTRQWAVASGSKAWVHFDVAQQQWSIVVESHSTPGLANAAALVDPSTGVSHVQQLDEGEFAGVRISAIDLNGAEWIGFDWLGAPRIASETSPGSFSDDPMTSQSTITLESGHIVTVEPVTGTIGAGGGS